MPNSAIHPENGFHPIVTFYNAHWGLMSLKVSYDNPGSTFTFQLPYYFREITAVRCVTFDERV